MSNEPRSRRIYGILTSRRAYRIFRFSAWWIAALGVFFVTALPVYDQLAVNSAAHITIQVIAAVLGSVGSATGLIIFFGMLAYVFVSDQSSWKGVWLLVFLLTACFGSSVYFFAVYRKQIPAM